MPSLYRRVPARELAKSAEHTRRFFAIPHGEMPLLIFVNPKSGGKQGEKILEKLQKLLSPEQVFDMMEKDPETDKVLGASKGAFSDMHACERVFSTCQCADTSMLAFFFWVRDLDLNE